MKLNTKGATTMTSSSRESTESIVLAVLSGTPVAQAAAQVPMEPSDLADAVETYRAAGRAALAMRRHEADWYQVRIQFADWNAAEQVATVDLGPRLHEAQQARVLADWWFIRKHPCWRLRCRPGPDTTVTAMKLALAPILDNLLTTGAANRWWETIYEPESLAFGGPQGMQIAHTLFHADSKGILLDYPRHHDIPAPNLVGRRELTLLLCTTLLRNARQDGLEQGDVWHRVEQLRPLGPDVPTGRLRGMIPDLQRLMTVDTTPTGALFGPNGAASFLAPWISAFATAGHQLADAARDGALERGIRDVLANHVIFHWNRLGLPTRTQAILARAARETLMNPGGF
ncbi:thiopeptide-type bacteriocin biosynthesis protein [Pseudonocardia acaciae]|uniref:thiopeptide-type bacteriocin biosynthesis protein n=1 Tax=Pseudonocardia acaciae TaxID=551276 RepID=UPI000AB63E06|nr:thiopeptide-type bacteriocin biosynthesis protein [Pseudonocardia acaciae]